VLLCHWIW